MGGTIICGVTESPEGRGVAELGHALGARLGLRVVLVHVADGASTDVESMLEAVAGDARNGTEKRVIRGEPAQGLAQVAAEEGADLIVLGSRAARLGSRRLQCTLARELEAATPVPVLVAPPATRRRSDRRLSVAAGPSTR